MTRTNNVILEGILSRQLKEINHINYKGGEFLFSEENIQTAIQKLKNVKYDGLQKTNEVIYDLITLGTAIEQTIEGDSKSFTLNYIDWRNPCRNKFHVVAEYSVDRNRSTETARPDIVLFVNGIPFAVIECKSPGTEVEQGVSQNIRNQGDDYIPRLFIYVQLLMATNKNETKYGTVGTDSKFWSVWNELSYKDTDVVEMVNTPLGEEQKAALFTGEYAATRHFFDQLEAQGDRLPTEQDKAIFALCKPDRLLELAFGFTLVDAGYKKIARYQQYFVVKSAMDRIKCIGDDERRKGGIVWHTQGSGKSLTMVMLARALALDTTIINPRILLVTDRDDLDKQLGNTFAACGLNPKRAESGRHLARLVSEDSASIITTLVHKFDKAIAVKSFSDPSPDIFILVDESHRTHFGALAAKMRQMFPNACYLGFTGTPILKKDKNNFQKFGGLIEPHYSIRQAVADGAVVPFSMKVVMLKWNKTGKPLTCGLSAIPKTSPKNKKPTSRRNMRVQKCSTRPIRSSICVHLISANITVRTGRKQDLKRSLWRQAKRRPFAIKTFWMTLVLSHLALLSPAPTHETVMRKWAKTPIMKWASFGAG